MICFRFQHKVLTAVLTSKSIQNEVVEWTCLRKFAERQSALRGTGVDLFDVSIGQSLSDHTNSPKKLASRPEEHMLVQIFTTRAAHIKRK